VSDRLAGLAVEAGCAAVAAAHSEIWSVSQRTFVERGEYELKGVPDRRRVYALVRDQATTSP
jgi:class 3 adenylate cyclase